MPDAWLDLKLNRPRLQKLAEDSSIAVVERAGDRTVQRARDVLRNGNHNRSGRLSASLQSGALRTGQRTTLLVGSNLRYAGWAENGRGPITARPGKTLRFVVNGKVVYAKKVRAAKGIRYLAKAFRQLRARDFIE